MDTSQERGMQENRGGNKPQESDLLFMMRLERYSERPNDWFKRVSFPFIPSEGSNRWKTVKRDKA